MFLNDLKKIWKYRHQLGYVQDIDKAVEQELAATATSARPIWQSYRFWSGLIMIAGVVAVLIFGVVPIEKAVTTDLVVALGTVIAGLIQIFAAKGQVKTERMIAAAAAENKVLASGVGQTPAP